MVARKRVEELDLATRVYRGALYALTDTLDDIGVTVSFLERAKGTLRVSGDSKFLVSILYAINCHFLKQLQCDRF